MRGSEELAEGANGRSYVIQTLDGALNLHPGYATPPAGDAKLVVDMSRWDGRTEPSPPGWEAVVLPALASDDVAILAQAMRKLPHPASPELARALMPHVGSPDGLVDAYLGEYLGRHPPSDVFRAALFAELATATPGRVQPILTRLKRDEPLDQWLNLVLVKLSADPSNFALADLLQSGIDFKVCVTRGHGRVTSDEVPALVTAWMKALRDHDLGAGPLSLVPGETDPALVPPSFRCRLDAGGGSWPPS